MVLVDIFVPSVNHVYDFQLDENTSIQIIIDEISELVEQKEHCKLEGEAGKLLLCAPKDSRILHKENTLAECGIRTGDSLLLV